MKIAVLGAGVIGVTSAWYLQRAGHEVVVVDRRDGPALETSYANGGQISVSHAVPWANPDAPREVLEWLGRRDAPLRFRPTADWRQWAWGARFLYECLPARTRHNSRRILALALESREALGRLRAELGLEYDQKTAGILSVYSTRASFDAAVRRLDLLGPEVERSVKSTDECIAIEPALAAARTRLAGGIHAPGDESGDAHAFTMALALACAQRGVSFKYRHTVERLTAADDHVSAAVRAPDGSGVSLAADGYVLALGAWSAELARGLGLDLPVYPVKGYSITLPVRDGDVAPHVSLTDEERKLVYSRLGSRLRVAGMAELGGFDASVDRRRCDAIVERAFSWFPRAGDRGVIECWAGLRPATPGNVPLVGRTRYRNLYLNTGHGTLGWTLACGSAQRLAAAVAA
jgi:D-amino-acid dehydrogenase